MQTEVDVTEAQNRRISALRFAQHALGEAQGELQAALATRDRAILDALATGLTQRQVARLCGLTPGRVAQIALRNA